MNVIYAARIATWLAAGLMMLALGCFIWGTASAQTVSGTTWDGNRCYQESSDGSWTCGYEIAPTQKYVAPTQKYVDPIPKALRTASEYCDNRHTRYWNMSWHMMMTDPKHYLPGWPDCYKIAGRVKWFEERGPRLEADRQKRFVTGVLLGYIK